MRIEPSAPCPHCKAENLAHRRTCWRCKRTLPTSFALDAELRTARLRFFTTPDGQTPPSRAEIEASLERAIIIGESQDYDEEEEPVAEGESRFSKRLLWLLGKRTA